MFRTRRAFREVSTLVGGTITFRLSFSITLIIMQHVPEIAPIQQRILIPVKLPPKPSINGLLSIDRQMAWDRRQDIGRAPSLT
jgi:hypothetical protein